MGKVFKPDLRKRAITRTFNAALSDAGLQALVVEVRDDKQLGLIACVASEASDGEITAVDMTIVYVFINSDKVSFRS